MRDYLLLYINGERHEVRGSSAFLMLADYLREIALLKGTKIVCAEGDCGACTVLRMRDQKFQSINSCIASLLQLDCTHILTIESIAEKNSELSEIQKSMRNCNGSQCGFCTPGFVMAMAGCFENSKEKITSPNKIKNQLTGNLCRCTGYQPIIDAALAVDPKNIASLKKRYHSSKIENELKQHRKISIKIENSSGVLFVPATTKEFFQLYKKNKKLKIIAGGTDLGVLVNKGKLFLAGEKKSLISTHLLREFFQIERSKTKLTIGAMVTLSELEKVTEKLIPEFARILRIFASPQIKNIATLAGNIANGSPIGDTLPALAVLGAVLILRSASGTRKVAIENFYLGYKKFDLRGDEIIAAIEINIPKKNNLIKFYKVSQRKDLDISYISAAYFLEIKNNKIISARIAYGGVAGTVIRLTSIEEKLSGESIQNQALWQQLLKIIPEQIQPRDDLRGSAQGRRILAGNLFKKFLIEERLIESPN